MSHFMHLETMGNYGINLVPFWKMEEADWVVLRLLTKGVFVGAHDLEAVKAQTYLYNKYGHKLVATCVQDLRDEENK